MSDPPAAAVLQTVAAGEPEGMRAAVIAALRTVFDPEVPVNIYDLGLIYELRISEASRVDVRMTLTAPGCPVAATFPNEVEMKVLGVKGVREAKVELTFDPPWGYERMSEAARLQLNV